MGQCTVVIGGERLVLACIIISTENKSKLIQMIEDEMRVKLVSIRI